MFTSVDRKPEMGAISHKPNKIRPYSSISDETADLDARKKVASNFMNRWNASVVDSIDFQGDKKACDIKDTKDALNCAL